MKEIHFYKMNGAGNDFVVIDNRDLSLNLSKSEIERLCDRHRGVGADGLLAVEPATGSADYKFRYYNADGGEAEMCGNGARCFARFVSHLPAEIPASVSFETIVGDLSAKILGENIQIDLSEPFDLEQGLALSIPSGDFIIDSINTGVPHVVVFVDDVDAIDVVKIGAEIRYHKHFSPAGTNVNFAQIIGEKHLKIRTYERGVEDETLACGTGMTACALIHNLKSEALGPIAIDVKGGDTLAIDFTRNDATLFSNVTLTGPADFVFEGDIVI